MTPRYDTLMALIDAWKGGDLEGALAHMADDIVWHYAAAIAPPITGKKAARRFLERFAAEARDVDWRITHHAESADRLFVEGVDDYTDPAGRRVATAYAGVLEFRGALITGWRDYFDLGVVEAQKAGQPRSAWLSALIAGTAG